MTNKRPFFDGHNDFLLRLMMTETPREDTWLGETGSGHLDLKRMQQGGFAGGLFAIFVPPISDGPPPDFEAIMAHSPYEIPLPPLMTHEAAQPMAMTMAGLFHWMERAASEDFKICRTAAEVRSSVQDDTIAGVLHMEGAEAIGPDLDALYLFHEMGLRSLGPVWSRPTIFGHGVPLIYPGSPDTGPGITEKGKDLVRLCNQLGIMIDLSHMNEAGFNDIAALSDAPLVATHSNAHVHCNSPRNLTDRQLGMIRDSGGMVGLNYATIFLNPDGTVSDATGWDVMARHLDHLIEHLGENHVGLGSDFDGCIVPKGIGDVTGVPNLFQALSDRGYDDALLDKIALTNWLDCLDRSLT